MEWRRRWTMQVWTWVRGKPASMAWGKPFRPSIARQCICAANVTRGDDGDQDVLDASVAQIIEDLGPELGTLVGLEPQAQNVPRPVRQDGQSHEDGLVRDRPIAADVDPDRIHEDYRVAGLQWAVLPGGHLVHDGIGDGRDQAGGRLHAVDLLDMALDLAGRHPARIHADDLDIELREAPLILGDQHRIEAAVAVARDVEHDL